MDNTFIQPHFRMHKTPSGAQLANNPQLAENMLS